MKQRIITLLLVITMSFSFFSCGALAAEQDSISVNGQAEAEVAPDMATLFGGLEKHAATAGEAREALAKDMASFKRFMLLQAVSDQDILTTRYSLQPEYIIEKNKRRLAGYKARTDYKIRIRDLEKLGTIIDRSIGSNLMIERIEFGLANRSLFENRLLDEAVENAKSKAAVVARAGGRTLGHLIRANLGTVTGAVRPMNRNMLMAKLEDGDSAPTELSPGVLTVEASVSLEFALN